MHLVAYNLIRQMIAVAAFRAGVEPWTVSFKGALQTINNLLPISRVSPTGMMPCWRPSPPTLSATVPTVSSRA